MAGNLYPTYGAQAAAAEKLVVTVGPGSSRSLVVDAQALMVPGDGRPRFWVLHPREGTPGHWEDLESRDGGPLAGVLRAIACLYLTPEAVTHG